MPPAPVTSTRRPPISCAMLFRSRVACGRPRRSLMFIGRISGATSTLSRKSSSCGMRARPMPSFSEIASSRCTSSPLMTNLVTIRRCGLRPSRPIRSAIAGMSSIPPRTWTPWILRPTRPPFSSIKPTACQADCFARLIARMNSSAESPAPTSSAGIRRSPSRSPASWARRSLNSR